MRCAAVVETGRVRSERVGGASYAVRALATGETAYLSVSGR